MTSLTPATAREYARIRAQFAAPKQSAPFVGVPSMKGSR